jgi:DNA replication protein DnaC
MDTNTDTQPSDFKAELAAIFARMKGRGMSDAELDQAERVERRRKRLNAAGLFDRPRLGEDQQAAAEHLDDKCRATGAVVVLCGLRGTGKTTLAREIQWLRADRDVSPGTYTLCQDVFEILRLLYGDFSDKREAEASLQRDRYVATSFLVIDEVHEVLSSKMGGRILNDLVIRRHAEGNPTILITNQPEEDTGLDPSILSRVNGSGFIFQPPWPPFR